MRDFIYEALPGRVVFGQGRVFHLAEEIDHLQKSRVLLIVSGSARRLVAGIADHLGPRFVGSFHEVVQHVPQAVVEKALHSMQETGVDCLVTLGGGSAIGLGKALALETNLPVIAIPTTFSGSEMTPIYGITDEGRKRTGRDLRVLPRTVIYDPQLVYSLPLSLAATSGINALAHCVEALYGETASPITDLMAEEGSRAIAQGLTLLSQDPSDHEGYDLTLYGAYLAGAVLAAVGTGLHHRICHVLGGSFNLPHAETHTVILPYVVRYNLAAAPTAMTRLARAFAASTAVDGITDLTSRLSTPRTLAVLGMPEDRLEEAAHIVMEKPLWNPRPVELSDIVLILQAAYAGLPA